MTEPRPELQARFDEDPDALEWARGHVQAQIDWLNEAAALPQAGVVFVELATWCAAFMRDTLIGNRLGHAAFGEPAVPALPQPTAEPVPVSVRWFDENGAYIDGETRSAGRGSHDMHALLAAWSARGHLAVIRIGDAQEAHDG